MASGLSEEQQAHVALLMSLGGDDVTSEKALECLNQTGWDVESAASLIMSTDEERAAAAQADAVEPAPYTGPRTLAGDPAPAASTTAGSSSRAAPPPRRGVAGIATLGSIAQAPGGGHGRGHGPAHDSDDDDSDWNESNPEEPRDLFAGGEKSGLAVQDPNNKKNDTRKVVSNILKKAKENASRPAGAGGEPAAQGPSRFRGGGQTLGGDDTPSQVIPDPNPPTAAQGPVQTRVLHLWNDGFSVEDGALRRFDDPQNHADLELIQQGRAPLHLMGVRNDQPVDVQLFKHDENYKALPKVYKPFSGGGNRLGSPTPGAATPSIPPPAAASTPASSTPSVQHPVVDPAQPTVMLNIQLPDGSRMRVRFQTTSTIGDVRKFLSGLKEAQAAKQRFILVTVQPRKVHDDESLVLGEMAEFKRGGNAIMELLK